MQIFQQKIPTTRLGKIFSWLLTFHIIVFLWIFFRASDFSTAWSMIRQIYTAFDYHYIIPFWNTRTIFTVMLLLGYLIHTIPIKTFDKLTAYYIKLPLVKAIGFVILVQLIVQFKNRRSLTIYLFSI